MWSKCRKWERACETKAPNSEQRRDFLWKRIVEPPVLAPRWRFFVPRQRRSYAIKIEPARKDKYVRLLLGRRRNGERMLNIIWWCGLRQAIYVLNIGTSARDKSVVVGTRVSYEKKGCVSPCRWSFSALPIERARSFDTCFWPLNSRFALDVLGPRTKSIFYRHVS